jgi:GT2 family glycosyltransferase
VSSAHRPSLSVVVRASARSGALSRKLDSLAAQTLAREAFEVLVARDPAGEALPDVIQRFDRMLPLRACRPPEAGQAAGWRHAASQALGELLLFLEDDDLPAPGLLAAHVEAHRRLPAVETAVLGAVELDPRTGSDPLPRLLHEACHGIPDGNAGDHLELSFFRMTGISLKRSFLLEHGEWDRPFPEGCEEMELAWRLGRHGLELVYDPAAVTRHPGPVTFDELCAAAHRQGRSDLAFARSHPHDKSGRMADVAEAPELWRRIAPVHEQLLRSARELDRLSALRRAAGLPLRDSESTLARRGYWTAFRTCRARAIAEPGSHPVGTA